MHQKGNTTIIVDAGTTGEYINLTTSTESGISPLEVTLTVDSSFDLTDATLTYIGLGLNTAKKTNLSPFPY